MHSNIKPNEIKINIPINLELSIIMSIFVPYLYIMSIIFNIKKFQRAKNAQQSAENAQEFVDNFFTTN